MDEISTRVVPTGKHSGGVVVLFWWHCDLFRIQGTLNQHGYHSILQRYAIPSGLHLLGLSFCFSTEQWLNTPPGCVRAIWQIMRVMEPCIRWPGLHNHPTSTQLRLFVIESDCRVKEKQPTSAQHMWELLQDCWKSIPRESVWENAKSVKSCYWYTFRDCWIIAVYPSFKLMWCNGSPWILCSPSCDNRTVVASQMHFTARPPFSRREILALAENKKKTQQLSVPFTHINIHTYHPPVSPHSVFTEGKIIHCDTWSAKSKWDALRAKTTPISAVSNALAYLTRWRVLWEPLLTTPQKQKKTSIFPDVFLRKKAQRIAWRWKKYSVFFMISGSSVFSCRKNARKKNTWTISW